MIDQGDYRGLRRTAVGGRVETSRIAVIGYGRMGRPMARRLMDAGHAVTVFDLEGAALRTARSDGADTAASAADASRTASVLVTLLPHPESVRAAAEEQGGLLSGLREDAVWLEMSSSHPEVTRTLASRAAERHAGFLDAPVSGGVSRARDGTLTIMVGGDPGLLESVRPVLETLGDNIVHVGPRPGDGDLVKTLNNLLSAVNLTAAAEAIAVALRGGLKADVVVDTIAASTGSSHALAVKFPRDVLTGTFGAGFTIDQMLKDLRISRSVADEWGVPGLVSSLVQSMWASLSAEGYGDRDHTEIAALVARRAGTRLPAGTGRDHQGAVDEPS